MDPRVGGRLEFLFEAETRPMICLDVRYLDHLREEADRTVGMYDPVFGLDEGTGALSATFQVEAISATHAAQRGTHLFVQALINAGVSKDLDVLEHISANLQLDDPILAFSEVWSHRFEEE